MTAHLRRALARLTPHRAHAVDRPAHVDPAGDTPAAQGAAASAGGPTASTGGPTAIRRRRSPIRVAALAATLLVLGGGSVAFASAHKTIAVDVDGEVTDVTTFAGSVDGLLTQLEVDLGARDVVAPSPDAALRDGDEVVVRHARQIAVRTDGVESHVWTTALDVDEALAALERRGAEVRLVASRSAADGRARLSADGIAIQGPVDVVVDGGTLTVEDGSGGLAAVLTELDVTVGPLDRVSVHRPQGAAGPVTVTVERVVAEEVATAHPIEFETVEERTDSLYRGEQRVRTEGVAGERTVVERVVSVDGEVESRMVLSDSVTTEPVAKVVAVGTKERPVVRAPRSSGGSSGSSSSGGSSAGGDVWAKLAQCESGGRVDAVSASGTYHGLYQFSVATWKSVGGSGLPSQASADEQTQRAQALQARSGWGQWPACSKKLGLR